MAATAQEVREFLISMRLALATGRFTLARRQKNLADLADLGMIPADVVRVLQHLSVWDYCEGPLGDDRGRARQWWVFGPQL